MSKSGYTIVLELRHPTMRPDAISTALQLDPDRCWSKGSAQMSAHGQPLGGYHDDNGWNKVLAEEPSDELPLAKCLKRKLKEFDPSAEFFHTFREQGGQAALEIQWRIGRFWPNETFDYQLIARLAAMQLDLRFDMYGVADGG